MTEKKYKIVFLGTGIWPKRLANLVNKYSNNDSYAVGVNILKSAKSIFHAFNACATSDAIVRVGIRPGMTHWAGRFFDCFFELFERINPRARYIYYWIGSDVYFQKEDVFNGNVTRHFHRSLNKKHLSGASWFVDELHEIGIKSIITTFPLELPVIRSYKTSNAYRVLTYIPDDRYKFYSGDLIRELAVKFSSVKFDVIGGRGTWLKDKPKNMKFYGWVKDISQFLVNRPVLLRLVRHDAVGGTVREALCAGCHVVYTYRLPHTYYVDYGDFERVESILIEIFKKHHDNDIGFLHNKSGSDFAFKEWDARVLTLNLISNIMSE